MTKEIKIPEKGIGFTQRDEIASYKKDGLLYVESVSRMWNRMASHFQTCASPNGDMIQLENVEIYDHKKGGYCFSNCPCIYRKPVNDWVRRIITCTSNFLVCTENRGDVRVDELTETDHVVIDHKSAVNAIEKGDNDYDRERFHGVQRQ